MKRKLLIAGGVVVLGGDPRREPALRAEAGRARRSMSRRRAGRELTQSVKSSGQIQPRIKVNISAHVIGKIEKLYVVEGRRDRRRSAVPRARARGVPRGARQRARPARDGEDRPAAGDRLRRRRGRPAGARRAARDAGDLLGRGARGGAAAADLRRPLGRAGARGGHAGPGDARQGGGRPAQDDDLRAALRPGDRPERRGRRGGGLGHDEQPGLGHRHDRRPLGDPRRDRRRRDRGRAPRDTVSAWS